MNAIQHSPPLIHRWLVGIFGSWLCVWLVGPWLVNSILVRVHDPALNAITLREGDLIAWRSEGWATTRVGPHGLPGWKPNQANDRIVLWGDSQVEGCCVNDPDKINNQLIQIANGKHRDDKQRLIDCLPIGRSGSNAVDWDRQTMAVDELWHPSAHVWIVTELSDLLALGAVAVDSSIVDRWQAESPAPVLWLKWMRAEAFFQASRNLLLDPTTGGPRSLRWSVGPIHRAHSAPRMPVIDNSNHPALKAVVDRLVAINQRLDGRLLLVYAPATPRIMDGIVLEHPDDATWEQLLSATATASIAVIDMRQPFIQHWMIAEEFPRGFHNGTPSFGHLNVIGNRLIADAIVERIHSRNERIGAIAP